MSEYYATIRWQRGENESYTDGKYSRIHQWEFDGGARVQASPSSHIVPTPYSEPANVDPEEAFVAALSSCHMLFFLEAARKNGFIVDQYHDPAVGIMAKNNEGNTAMTQVTLKPHAIFAGDQPTSTELEEMHHWAHQQCFIANSVKTEVVTDIQV